MATASIFRSLMAVSLLLISCAKRPENDLSSPKTFIVQGYIEKIENDGARLVIDHEEMPDYMPPMIMPFTVKNPKESATLAAGDQIRFAYKVAPTRSWIEDIEKTGLKRSVKPDSDPIPSTASLNEGDILPDYSFLDENGAEVSLSRYRGQPVAITFIFTRCPVPEYCPAMMRNFGNVDELLREHQSAPKSWRLLTISFDPKFDTPEAMRSYGNTFGYNADNWSLLSATSLEPIKSIAKNVGLKFGKKDGSYLHNLRTVVLDPEGRITKIFTDETWSPEELADELIRISQ